MDSLLRRRILSRTGDCLDRSISRSECHFDHLLGLVDRIRSECRWSKRTSTLNERSLSNWMSRSESDGREFGIVSCHSLVGLFLEHVGDSFPEQNRSVFGTLDEQTSSIDLSGLQRWEKDAPFPISSLLSCGFSGADDDIEASKIYIKEKYLSLVPPRHNCLEKNIYPHFTCSVGQSFVASTSFVRMFPLLQIAKTFASSSNRSRTRCWRAISTIGHRIDFYSVVFLCLKRKINVRSTMKKRERQKGREHLRTRRPSSVQNSKTQEKENNAHTRTDQLYMQRKTKSMLVDSNIVPIHQTMPSTETTLFT